MVQLAPDAKLVPQLFENTNDEASAPVTLMLLIVKVGLPVFFSVTLWEALVLPTSRLPKERLVADRDTVVSADPVPLSAMLCGEPVALSVIVTLAVNAPDVAGAK